MEKIILFNNDSEFLSKALKDFTGCLEIRNIKLISNLKNLHNAGLYLNLPDEDYILLLHQFLYIYSMRDHGFSHLEYIDAEENPYCKSIDGVLYSKDGTVLIYCPDGRKGDFIIPEGVISIGEYAFHKCEKITSLKFPDSLRHIGFSACRDMTALTSIDFGHGIKTLGSHNDANIFRSCKSLQSITIPCQVNSIGKSAFVDCTALHTVNLVSGLERIEEEAFFNTLVEKIELPDTMKYLEFDSLSECNEITIDTSLHIPEGLLCGLLYGNRFFSTEIVTLTDRHTNKTFFIPKHADSDIAARYLYYIWDTGLFLQKSPEFILQSQMANAISIKLLILFYEESIKTGNQNIDNLRLQLTDKIPTLLRDYHREYLDNRRDANRIFMHKLLSFDIMDFKSLHTLLEYAESKDTPDFIADILAAIERLRRKDSDSLKAQTDFQLS